MLISVLDWFTGLLSRKWLIGRRFVLDLTESRERRVAVVCLPEGAFSFDLRQAGEVTELVLASAGATTQVIATFDDLDEAEFAAKKIKIAMVRPLKRVVMACLGVLIIFLAFDAVTAPRAASRARAAASSPTSLNAPAPSLEQLNAAIAARNASAQGSAPQSATAGPAPAPAAVARPEGDPQSSPEAQAAIRLLKGAQK